MRTLSVLLACGCLIGRVAAQTPAMSGAPEAPAIAKALARKLNKPFPGWQLAVPDGACQAAAGSAPSVVTADFNSDTLKDTAVQLRATAPGIAMAVAFKTLDDYKIVAVDTGAGGEAPRMLSVARRGSKYNVPGSNVDEYFTHDTLVATTCAGVRTAYVWNGRTFTSVALGSKAPAPISAPAAPPPPAR